MDSSCNKFMESISEQFNNIKEDFKCKISRIGLSFNDDIFSDTIIKCNNNLKNKNCGQKEMISYFWQAFKNNTLRELYYSRNKLKEELNANIKEHEETDVIDFDAVSNLIIKNFGCELYQLFALHANGTTYEELSKISDINNLKYRFRCIRKFVRDHYCLYE